MSVHILFVTPDEFTAASLKRQFGSPDLNAAPWHNLMGHRGDLVLVFPPRPEMGGVEREHFDRCLREVFPTKVTPGGRMFFLTEGAV